MDFSINTPYDDDRELLAELGLEPWRAPLNEETFIGEVFPYPAEEEPEGRTKIGIYVTCSPAQFYRFVIVRRSELDDYAGMEELSVKTGSGSLRRYWEMVMAVASNCLVVSNAKLLSVN